MTEKITIILTSLILTSILLILLPIFFIYSGNSFFVTYSIKFIVAIALLNSIIEKSFIKFVSKVDASLISKELFFNKFIFTINRILLDLFMVFGIDYEYSKSYYARLL